MDLKKTIDRLVEIALDEDIGSGDITTSSLIDENATSNAIILAKENLILSGIDVARRVFYKLDPDLNFASEKDEGDNIGTGEVIARLNGRTASILSGERVALNFLQHLSGVATLTSKYSIKTVGTKTKILDTRKTTPGMRLLEKRAVKSGGGENHRIGLFDMILIKDNHITAAGSIEKAVFLAKSKTNGTVKIEVEVENMIQVKQAIEANADIIMLDNMSIREMGKAIAFIGERAKVEISGNVNLDRLDCLIALKPDYISVGKITHSAPSVDISMEFLPD